MRVRAKDGAGQVARPHVAVARQDLRADVSVRRWSVGTVEVGGPRVWTTSASMRDAGCGVWCLVKVR